MKFPKDRNTLMTVKFEKCDQFDVPLPNHSGNIKGGLVVGQWEQNGMAH